MSKTWGKKRYSIKIKKNKHELDNKEFHIREREREEKKEHENFYANKQIIKRI